MDVKQKQIEFLERFISGDIGAVKGDAAGLCSNIRWYSGEDIPEDDYIKMIAFWPEFSTRDVNYPINGGKDVYLSFTPKYEGEQLRLRISLAKHLLEGLRG